MKKIIILLSILCAVSLTISVIMAANYKKLETTNNELARMLTQLQNRMDREDEENTSVTDQTNDDKDESESKKDNAPSEQTITTITTTTTPTTQSRPSNTTHSQAPSNSNEPEDEISDYEKKIAELNKTIEALNQGLQSADEALEKLKNNGTELSEWDKATEALPSKLQMLEREYNNHIDLIPEENKQQVQTLFNEAKNNLYKAVSVDEMDKIIEQFVQDLNNLIS
jgi:chromosome segregation ATPase